MRFNNIFRQCFWFEKFYITDNFLHDSASQSINSSSGKLLQNLYQKTSCLSLNMQEKIFNILKDFFLVQSTIA